ncbi:MAG: hypothetical protein LBE89_05820 [Helicobacteraceae bacterium]|jgi:hypothetical protein|nr:hypothetical protein [Helicobacteraceae bacterium]
MIKVLLLLIWAVVAVVVFAATVAFVGTKSVGAGLFAGAKRPQRAEPAVVPDFPLNVMEDIIRNKNSDIKELSAVALAIAAHHPVEPKKGGKTDKAAKHLLELIFTLAGHKNMTSEMRSEMYAKLEVANPSYKKDFDRAKSK